jgi:FKBP-type peptidyl-prolyl cis-trans isomerase FkpA/FKBP-type peptidyl-prolyl cis-trans isomerase FklB
MISKRLIIISLMASAAAIAGCSQQEESAAEVAELETLEQKVNYVFGMNIANNMKEGELQIEPAAFAQALKDIRDGVEPRLSEEESMAIMQTFQEQQMTRRQEESKVLAEKNSAEAEAFFAENGAKEDVVTTESGLQYKVLEAGEGVSPSIDSVVTVHYSGKLLDGTEFDSSYSRNQPATFDLGGVISGWTEALLLMSKGAKWELYIPADLAYGPGGHGPIPPNAALVFEVELLEINGEEDEQ